MAYQCRRGVVSVPRKKGPHDSLKCGGLLNISGVMHSAGLPSDCVGDSGSNENFDLLHADSQANSQPLLGLLDGQPILILSQLIFGH